MCDSAFCFFDALFPYFYLLPRVAKVNQLHGNFADRSPYMHILHVLGGWNRTTLKDIKQTPHRAYCFNVNFVCFVYPYLCKYFNITFQGITLKTL